MPRVQDEIHLEVVLKGTFVRDLLQLLEQSIAPVPRKGKTVEDEPKPLFRETSPLAVSVKEAAATVGISRSEFYKLLNEGEIKSIRIGRRNLIPMEELKTFVAQGIR